MIVKRLRAAVPVLCLGLMLASCADFVADHWPHAAGGEPNGLPPRPGEPGYQQFIAHGQPDQNTGSVSGEAQPPPAGGAPEPAGAKAAAATQDSADPDPKTGNTGGQPGGGSSLY
jgi:hypothetical protein